MKLHAPGVLAYILQSPAHHQIHHSTDPRHFDKNLGYCLSVWDYVFGTLYIPQKNEKVTFGLLDTEGARDKLARSTSLATHFILPFQRIWAQIKPRPAAVPLQDSRGGM